MAPTEHGLGRGHSRRDLAGEFAFLDYAHGALAKQSPNHRANVLRMELLARHGGVWVDATCFCVRPLDEWLPAQMSSGFFAFARPARSRLLANWFLAARPTTLSSCGGSS